MSRRKKKCILGDLESRPASVVMDLVNHAVATQRETLAYIDKMLSNPELLDETRSTLIAKRSDSTKQATELAVAVAAAFGKRPAITATPVAGGLPATPTTPDGTFSPPRPGARITPIAITKEPK